MCYIFLFILSLLLALSGIIMLIFGLVKRRKPTWIIGILLLISGLALFIHTSIRAGEAAWEQVNDRFATLDEEYHENVDTTLPLAGQGGKFLGERFSEFVTGFAEGVDQQIVQVRIFPEDTLKKQGVIIGRNVYEGDSLGRNIISIYMRFEQDFQEALRLTTYDASDAESGSISRVVSGKAGTSKYVDFIFDRRMSMGANGYAALEVRK